MSERERPSIDPKFVVDLRGKSFVMMGGLLDLAHRTGLQSIETEIQTELCVPEKEFWVVRATVRFRAEPEPLEFSAVGDASPGSSQMRGAYLRHAETRAVARALRFATNIAMCSVEELGPDADDAPRHNGARTNGDARTAPQRAKHDPEDHAAHPLCSVEGCGVLLNKNEAVMSQQYAKRPLCKTHLTEFRQQTADQATGKAA